MFVVLKALVVPFPPKLMPVEIRDVFSDMHKKAPVCRQNLTSVKASLLLGLCPTSFHTAVQHIKLSSCICGQNQILSV